MESERFYKKGEMYRSFADKKVIIILDEMELHYMEKIQSSVMNVEKCIVMLPDGRIIVGPFDVWLRFKVEKDRNEEL